MTNKLFLEAGPHEKKEKKEVYRFPVQWNTVKYRCVFFSTAPIGLRLLSVSEWGLLLRAGWRLHL